MGALLIPESQLSGKLRVLIYPRLDLQWSVDKFRFGEGVHHRPTVLCGVAASAIQPIRLFRLARVNGRISTNSTPVSPGSFISMKFGCIAGTTAIRIRPETPPRFSTAATTMPAFRPFELTTAPQTVGGLASGVEGIFPFVLRRAIILPMGRRKECAYEHIHTSEEFP